MLMRHLEYKFLFLINLIVLKEKHHSYGLFTQRTRY